MQLGRFNGLMSKWLAVIVDYAWGTPLLLLLMGGGLYLVLISRLRCLFALSHAFKLLSGRVKHDEGATGQISQFQALSNALSATIGLGNIAGVAVAISQGGPGAIFWMWASAAIGMNTKFFECTLSVMFRGKDYKGEVQGGPMYVIEKTFSKNWRWLAYFFAFCALGSTLSIFNANQLASFLKQEYAVPSLPLGIGLAFLVVYIVRGGVQRLAGWTSKIVPFMCVFYILSAALIIGLNFEKVPEIFALIFQEAFTGRAAGGGLLGISVLQLFRVGVKRAAFSNEAGIGTAPMAHGNAKTSEPIAEGLVAMLGPLIDTILVCTMTALVILIALDPLELKETSGILMTAKAFEKALPGWGIHLLSISIFFFSFSTLLGMVNYNKKCWDYFFKGRWYMGDMAYYFFYAFTIVLGCVVLIDDVVNFLDICGALMSVPNMLATLWLSRKVVKGLYDYRQKYLSE